MKWPSRRTDDTEPKSTIAQEGLQRLVEVGESDVGRYALAEALRLTLDGMLPEQRAEFLGMFIDLLSAGSRLAILSGAVTPGEMVTQLEARERRPGIIADLIEHGHETHEVDLTLIPEGCLLEILLYRPRPGVFINDPRQLSDQSSTTLFGKLRAVSLGRGGYAMVAQFRFTNDGAAEAVMQEGYGISLSSRDLRGNTVRPTAVFGQELWIKPDKGGTSQLIKAGGRTSEQSKVIVGQVFIDDQSALHEI